MVINDLTHGVLLCHEGRGNGIITDYLDVKSQRIAAYKTDPKSKKERETIWVDSYSRLPNWILSCIGHLKIYTLQDIIGLKSNIGMLSADSKSFWASFEELYGCGSNVFISKEYPNILAIHQLGRPALNDVPFCKYVFGANTEAVLEELIAGSNGQFVWLRNVESHHTITKKEVEEVPLSQKTNKTFEFDVQPRALYSIEPILQFLSDFANLSGDCESIDYVEKCERKHNISLPQPLKEYYCYFPKVLYQAYNVHTPLSRLKLDKFGKMKFLIESEQIYSCAFEPESPFVFSE